MNRLKGAGTNGCCPCDQFVNCDCGPIACGVECQSKNGTATLCGFSEFTTPSTPPKKYRKRAKTGTMYQATWPTVSCPQDAGSTQSPFVINGGSWGGLYDNLGDGPYEQGHTASFLVTKVVGGYTITFYGGTWKKGVASGSFLNMAISGGPGGAGSGYIAPGHTSATIPGGNYTGVALYYDLAGARAFANDPQRTSLPIPFVLGAGAANSIRDVWNQSSVYPASPNACGAPSVTDTSARYQQAGGAFPLTSGGSISGSVADPDAQLITTTTQRTMITIDATQTCVQTGTGPDVWSQAQGQTVDQLTLEETEADAIARADALIANWTACVTGCVTCPSYKSVRGPGQFSINYTHTQVRANLSGMTPTHSYTVTFQFFYRLHGTNDPWKSQGTGTIDITATATTGTTDWIDVPQMNGYDVMCNVCSAEE
jgi:hypothetical protein